MDLATRLIELQKRTLEHREVLLTEEAAKTALVMPFLQALGYDVFNPGEAIPEFTADVGTKKGEKVDYAICNGGKISILVECKPSSAALNVNHAAQLFRYFSVTDARLAVLTNGVSYQFYSDIEKPNKMDDKPFFSFSMDAVKPGDSKTLEKFTKSTFDIDNIVQEAALLKTQSLLRKKLENEFSKPSDEFVNLFARRVHTGRITQSIKDETANLLIATINNFVRDLVSTRLSSALDVTNSVEPTPLDENQPNEEPGVVTTAEETSGFHIVQAIASRLVNPKRIVLRDAKSYAAILLDDNNRKTVVRLHFNGLTQKYVGLFYGKDENRQVISDLTDIYQFGSQIESRLRELDSNIPA